MDIPSARMHTDRGDSARHIIRQSANRQLPSDNFLQEGELLQGRDLQRGTEPGMCEDIVGPWIARNLLISVVKFGDIALETRFTERYRNLLRIPDNGILDPRGRIGSRTPRGRSIRIILPKR
jgi:hypothetical protein